MTETIKGAKELIRVYMAKGIPAYIWGPPGCGKSDAWRQVAAEQGIGFKDLRLGQMDQVDLRGLPTIHNDLTTWVKPDFWPILERDGPKGIILFDELSDTTKSMQSSSYQIILDHKAGEHEILPGWYCAAAGNRREDKAAAMAVSTALANRFAHIDVAPDPEAFVEWCYTTDYMGHYVPGFIRFRPNLLWTMEGSDLRAFASPRSWARAALVADEANPSLRFRLMRGLVGEGPASEFEAFMKVMDLPDFDDIVKDPKRTRIPREPSSRYALSCQLSRYAKRDNFGKIWEYIRREEYGRDFQICTVLDATKRDASLTETKAFIDFANANQDLQL